MADAKSSCRLHFNSAEDAYLKSVSTFDGDEHSGIEIWSAILIEVFTWGLGDCPEPEAALQLRRQGDAA